MNTVQLIGRLTKDPELRLSATSDPMCTMRIAVDRMGENGSTGYVDVVVFGRPGQACAEQLSRGWLVGVAGRLRHREWTAGDGTRRSGLSVVGSVEFLSAPRAADPEPIEPVAAA